MCHDKYYEARVFSGIGEGEFYVSLYAKSFREKLGINPYPGTLNTWLLEGHREEFNRCLKTLGPVIVEPPKIPGARLGSVLAWKALVNGVDSFIVRPIITVYREDVVELISEKYLRGLLGISDGDIVSIRILARPS